MEKENYAKQLGYKYAFIGNLIGLLIASLILMSFASGEPLKTVLLVPVEFVIGFKLNIAVGITAMFISAYYLGQKAGVEILSTMPDPHWIGLKTGMLILIISTIAGSLVGFFKEGIGSYGNPFYHYLFKPLFWVISYGFIPVVLVGIWYGYIIEKKLKNNTN